MNKVSKPSLPSDDRLKRKPQKHPDLKLLPAQSISATTADGNSTVFSPESCQKIALRDRSRPNEQPTGTLLDSTAIVPQQNIFGMASTLQDKSLKPKMLKLGFVSSQSQNEKRKRAGNKNDK